MKNEFSLKTALNILIISIFTTSVLSACGKEEISIADISSNLTNNLYHNYNINGDASIDFKFSINPNDEYSSCYFDAYKKITEIDLENLSFSKEYKISDSASIDNDDYTKFFFELSNNNPENITITEQDFVTITYYTENAVNDSSALNLITSKLKTNFTEDNITEAEITDFFNAITDSDTSIPIYISLTLEPKKTGSILSQKITYTPVSISFNSSFNSFIQNSDNDAVQIINLTGADLPKDIKCDLSANAKFNINFKIDYN